MLFFKVIIDNLLRNIMFLHRTSSPGYAQSNAKAERGVGIVKSVLNKAFDRNADLYLSLLAYRPWRVVNHPQRC